MCGLCDRLVQFVIRRDRADRFRFALLQSDLAAKILSRYGANPRDLNTLYLLVGRKQADEQLLTRSAAVIAILRELGSPWHAIAASLGFVPLGIRDWCYSLIARNRYRIFGKFGSCILPTQENRHKFLDS
ncbi:MAG: thiol-disulfide oxidoreductase DCC family protein [Terriglobales bacterium]